VSGSRILAVLPPLILGAVLSASAFVHALPLSAQAEAPPPVPGQSQAADERPGPDNPEVAFMFLLHHHGLIGEVRKLAAAKASAAGDTERAAAASMDLSVADFRAVDVVYSQVSALLQAVDKDADAYRDQVLSGAVALDIATLHQFNDRRTRVKASIKRRLQATLSPEGWIALNSYMEGRFREGVHMRRAQ
jgi:hypothetical protein